MTRNKIFVVATICAAVGTGCGRREARVAEDAAATRARKAVDEARIIRADEEPGNWMTYGRTYSEQRFSPLKQINESNVGQLGFAWHYDLDTHRGQEATPIVVDGVMYFTSAWSKAFALDAATGALQWSYDPKVPPEMGRECLLRCGESRSGRLARQSFLRHAGWPAYRAGCRDGQENLGNADDRSAKRYTITGAPRVVKGQSSHRQRRRGDGRARVCFRLRRGDRKLAWRFLHRSRRSLETVRKPDSRESRENLDGRMVETRRRRHGVGRHRLRSGTRSSFTSASGNGGPWSGKFRSPHGGDDLLTCSIVALKPDTGEYVWHYQEDPDDDWDYDSDEQIILADLTIDGSARKVLLHAPKNGFFYVLDRATGALISAKPFTFVNWATGIDLKTGRPIENPAARYVSARQVRCRFFPGPSGAHSWQPMSFSPLTGLVYIPIQDAGFLYKSDPQFQTETSGGELWARSACRGHAARSKCEESDPGQRRRAPRRVGSRYSKKRRGPSSERSRGMAECFRRRAIWFSKELRLEISKPIARTPEKKSGPLPRRRG